MSINVPQKRIEDLIPQLNKKQNKLVAGANINIDNTDPNNPVISSENGAGVSNYNELENKPSINGKILENNKTAKDLYLFDKDTLIGGKDIEIIPESIEEEATGRYVINSTLDTSNLSTKEDLNKYLPLSGGKITSDLEINNNLILGNSDNNATTTIYYEPANSTLQVDKSIKTTAEIVIGNRTNQSEGRISYDWLQNWISINKGLNIGSSILRRSTDGANVLWATDKAKADGVASLDTNAKLLTAQIPIDNDTIVIDENGNLKSTVKGGGATGDYVPLSGGTMTGQLVMDKNSNGIYFEGNPASGGWIGGDETLTNKQKELLYHFYNPNTDEQEFITAHPLSSTSQYQLYSYTYDMTSIGGSRYDSEGICWIDTSNYQCSFNIGTTGTNSPTGTPALWHTPDEYTFNLKLVPFNQSMAPTEYQEPVAASSFTTEVKDGLMQIHNDSNQGLILDSQNEAKPYYQNGEEKRRLLDTNDLTTINNKIPTLTSQLTNNSGFITSVPKASSTTYGTVKLVYTSSTKTLNIVNS
ncbi:MAG: hypothetical protein NC222_06095 [Staphylococcus sp.]|nr:hypothetical protein [Staphylococcus sp.]